MAVQDHIETETTDVIICGCGPTGAMLSAHLDRLGVHNICLDREDDITNDPRGIALDEDGIRALQSLGIYDKIFTEIGQCMGVFKFVDGTHSNLESPAFMSMDYTTSEGGTGHVGFICHKQPSLEKYLRLASAGSEYSQLRTSCTVTNIDEDDQWVYAEYMDKTSSKHRLRARYLIGADGKTGYTRKKYLEPKGVLMKQASASHYKETWIAINWRMTMPTPETHPDFPLWSLGYTPQQVYDLFFPKDFRFLCNPQRAAVCGRFGRPEDCLWRFEYVVSPGEDGNEMASYEKVKEVVFPYITRSGDEYGVPGSITYPEDCIETLRARPFEFSARSCNTWSLGRVVLCGDSAHVFPPFGGQGIASGFRDACALAWRLKVACQDNCTNYQTLLEAWYNERKQQLEQSLAATVENGKYVTEGNPIRIFVRNTYFALVQMIPSWKRWLEQGARRNGMARYTFEAGMHFLPNLGGGFLFPQVYCTSLVGNKTDIRFTDDVIFERNKTGLFQLVALASSNQELEEIKGELKGLGDLNALSDGYVQDSESTFIVEDVSAKPESSSEQAAFRIATAEEFASSPLCINRPKPEYYDELRMGKEMGGKRYAIVRQDRFVYAVCADEQELKEALGSISKVLGN